MNLLELTEVSKVFGGLMAVKELSFSVRKGAIQGLIGPNGSGKSTVFNIIAGSMKPHSGHIRFNSEDVSGVDTVTLVEKGLARTFQATQVFGDFTVSENVTLSAQVTSKAGLLKSFVRSPSFRGDECTMRSHIEEILDRLKLLPRATQVARDLSYRDQKMLALANALATRPELLMLDEPMAGLTARETRETMEAIRWARGDGKTILLIEHDMRSVMELCERIVVMNQGEKICDGTPDEVRRSSKVIDTYLGVD